ncbi:hypothetical protein [Actinacidiphila acidipaludis]|uniref:Lipoprotein n=1 Tax=Actinacidiphila acidipaludis TaxID=2873382 RepID=A0ABS7QIS2_9ACTN|nr:hypothetical protein [Streptomyces acidipaludis]MBY8883070.1 hypothetical protein [Streptomyces acidipaludis]
MSRPAGRGHGVLVGVLAVAGMLVTGCSGGGDDAAAPSPDPSATPASTSSPGTASATPSPPPSPVYPTGAAGCHPDHGWSQAQAAEWVKFGQIGTPTWTDGTWGHVRFDKSLAGFDGPLCEAVTVQVQYWKVTYRASDDGPVSTDGSPQYTFTTVPLARTQLRVAGRSVRNVHLRSPGDLGPS